MSERDGGPAFPSANDRVFHPAPGAMDPRTGSWGPSTTGGMSLRDYFAAQALTSAVMAAKHAGEAQNVRLDWGTIGPALATIAYNLADAMLAEREK